jgi:DNA-binding transcriptional MerR regulator
MLAMTTHTIGQLARLAGVPTSTVRFYERAGLLKPDARSGGNYRHYGDAAVSRLRFIRSAQATGFSLGDIRGLLSLTHSDDAPCDDVLALTKQRLADVRERIRELRHVERVLSKSLNECCTGTGPDLCEEIVRLKHPGASACKPAGACPPKKSAVRA